MQYYATLTQFPQLPVTICYSLQAGGDKHARGRL